MSALAASRRDVLKAATALGLLGLPDFLLEAGDGIPADPATGVLVVVQLSGGNDGLNTLIPHRDDDYYRARPRLALPRNGAHALPNSDLALHPRLGGLVELYKEGALAILPGVGYPNPDRSHFRSMDIWHTAEPERARQGTGGLQGWLGACIDERHSALHVGDEQQPLALSGRLAVPSVGDLDFLSRLTTPTGQDLRKLLGDIHRQARQGAVEQTRQLAQVTLDRLERLLVIAKEEVPVGYPASLLGQRLRLTGQLIAGDFPNRIFYLTQAGYDTHANQLRAHANLLGDLGDGLQALYRHLQAAERAERVTVLVFSEFGRRVAENGSFGTDHGAAGPAFLIGDPVTGGIHGRQPSLSDLDQGDLKYSTDFRSVYASALGCAGIEVPAVLRGQVKLWK